MMSIIILTLIYAFVASDIKRSTFAQTVIADYSELANEAENNKNHILQFLNKTQTQQLYRVKFETLLDKLTGSTRRIVSGKNTSITAVPWQASIREKTFPICGGSVVTEYWILTAAHCLLRAQASDLTVRFGSSWKTHGGEMYDVSESHVHPRYTSSSKANDAGLVKLYTPLRFSSRVLPIRIVAREKRLPANQLAIVSGWGKLREGGLGATFLQSATVSTLAMKLCRQSGLERKSIDPGSMFCAGSFTQPAPDACQGDSGGPIVSEGVLVGVVSWGLGCARGNFPGVYTRLSHPIVWDWVHVYVTKKPDTNVTF